MATSPSSGSLPGSDDQVSESSVEDFKPFRPSISTQQKYRRKKNPLAIVIAVLSLLIIGGLGWSFQGPIGKFFAAEPTPAANDVSAKQKTPETKPRQSSPQKAKPRSSDSQPFDLVQDPPPELHDDKPMPDAQASFPEVAAQDQSPTPLRDSLQPTDLPQEPSLSEEEQKQLQQHLLQAFQAMQLRQQDQAAVHLKASVELTGEDPLLQQVESMRALHRALDRFWGEVEKSMAGMSAGNELVVGSTPVIVIDSDVDRIRIRFLGENRDYARADLPSGLACALVEHRLNKNASSTKVILGAFRLVDRNGDPKAARQLWDEAANLGADVSLYLPLLDFFESIADAETEELTSKKSRSQSK